MSLSLSGAERPASRRRGRVSLELLCALCVLGCAPPPEPGEGGTGGAGEPGSGGQTSASGGGDASGPGAGGSGTTGGSGGTGGVPAESQPRKRAFLLLGQSNMAGYPQILPGDRVEEPRIQVLGYDDCQSTGRKTNEWDTATPPLHACWSNALGPGDHFARRLLESLPEADTIGLVPCAIPGEKIETFLRIGGSKYDWIVERARIAQDTGYEIEGILFHQGESNCNDSNWPQKVKTLVEDLRSELGLGEVPFLAGELLYTGCGSHNTLVNQLPGSITNAAVVSASGLVVADDDEWKLHFSHDSVVTQGQRYADAMIEALGLTPH